MTDTPRCRLDGCHHVRPAGWPLCLDHWRLVPVDLRDRIWKMHRGLDSAPMRLADAYEEACDRALLIAAREMAGG